MASIRPLANKGFQIGQVLGIPVFIDWSWLIIFAIVTYANSQLYAVNSPSWPPSTVWLASVVTSLLYFLSIFLHEVGHSVVARHYKIEVTSITLFIFGGVASIRTEPKTARQEFWIAVAGPAVSLVLATVLFGIHLLTKNPVAESEFLDVVSGMSLGVAEVNAALVLFNLLPGFPLDGGRIFRSLAWWYTKDFHRSTKIAAWAGRTVAVGLGLLGIGLMLFTRSVSSLWIVLIAVFIYRAASQTLQRAQLFEAVAGIRARDLLDRTAPVVSPALSLRRLFESYIIPSGHHRFLVFDGARLRGLITAWEAERIPAEEWDNTSVQATMMPCAELNPVRLDTTVEQVMQQMEGDGVLQVPVVESGVFYGLVTREGVLRAVSARLAAAGHRI